MLKNFKDFKALTFYEILFLLFPVILILKPLVINSYLILISFLLIYQLFKKKYLHIYKEVWVYFFFLFIFYSIFRGFFAKESLVALQSSISLIRFLCFSLFIFLCIQSAKNLNIIIKFWTFLLILLCIDTLIQYFFLENIFSFKQENNYRLTGMFTRPVIGAYLTYISIPIIFYFFLNIKNFNFNQKILLFSIYFLLFITIALSGERLALISFFFSSIIIFLFCFRISHFIYLFFFILALLLIIYYSSYEFSYRVNQLYFTITNFSISPWGRLFHSAYLVFDSNIIFGVGLKNYSIVCDTQIVDPLYYVKDLPPFCSTHPHHFYLEILSESGIVGFFLLFLFFGFFLYSTIKKIKKLRNNVIYKQYKGLLYGSILILLIYFWPIKTSGRFFTTWNGSFFWFNLGIVLLITKNFYKKNSE
jgi:O-antigen ligase